jgi:hypothetical protein
VNDPELDIGYAVLEVEPQCVVNGFLLVTEQI